VLRRYRHIAKGHLYDLPDVVADAVVPDDLKDRVEVHGGSFLDESSNIPAGADAYIMKHIIHDWDDQKVRVMCACACACVCACACAVGHMRVR
jgi:hypothetical protein